MLKRLRERWKVSGTDLLLIITTFALGGSGCAKLAGFLLSLLFNGDKNIFWWISYLLLITVLWPICVLVISIPLLQYRFFSNYLKRVGRRIFTKSHPSTIHNNKIAIFASGNGSNVENFISYFSKITEVEISLIVCNNPNAGVIDIAKRHHKKILLIENDSLSKPDELIDALKKDGIDFIVLAGFLKKLPEKLLSVYPDRIVNIHPSLLPAFGGQGMYGMKVHDAVLQSGVSQSGITIHKVNEHYDEGEIIFQAACDVVPEDTTTSLNTKIHMLEKAHYPPIVHQLLVSAKT